MRAMAKTSATASPPREGRRSSMIQVAVLTLAAVTLTACSGDTDIRRQLGLDRQGPDAFRVVAQAPLELPPGFGLRPPQPGAPRPNEATTAQQARSAVFGTPALTRDQLADGTRSGGEVALLRQAGAVNLDPSVREAVDRESQQLAAADRRLIDRILFWREAEPAGTVVDPTAETRRLRENSALGLPASTGQTPSIQRRRRGLLEGLF